MRDSYVLYKDRLNDSFLPVFERVELFVLSCDMDKVTVESKLSELVDTFISEQEDGRAPEDIVGEDVRAFCRTFVSECSWKYRLLNFLDNVRWVFWVIVCSSLIIDVLPVVYEAESGGGLISRLLALKTPYLVVGICLTGFIATAINAVTRALVFKTKPFLIKLLPFIGTVVYFACIFLFFNLTEKVFPSEFDIPLWTVLVCGILYLAVYYITNHKRLKLYRSQKTDLFSTVSTEVGSDYDMATMKRYIRKRDRIFKRKKQEFTLEEFLTESEKRCLSTYKLAGLYKAIPWCIFVLNIINDLITGNYDSYFMLFGSCFLNLIFQTIIFRSLWRLIKSANDLMMSWIKEKRNNMQ